MVSFTKNKQVKRNPLTSKAFVEGMSLIGQKGISLVMSMSLVEGILFGMSEAFCGVHLSR